MIPLTRRLIILFLVVVAGSLWHAHHARAATTPVPAPVYLTAHADEPVTACSAPMAGRIRETVKIDGLTVAPFRASSWTAWYSAPGTIVKLYATGGYGPTCVTALSMAPVRVRLSFSRA